MRFKLTRFANRRYLVSTFLFALALTKFSFAYDQESIEHLESGHLPHGHHHETGSSIKSPSRYEQLEEQRFKAELECINHAFNNIDDLFARAVIKAQTIDEKGELHDEVISTLYDFLSSPHEIDSVVNRIEKYIKRKLNEYEIKLLRSLEKLSFPNAVKILWTNKTIDDKKARSMMLDNSLLSPRELIRLVENGAARTKSGHLVQLRTGRNYGDPLKLFDDLSEIAKRLQLKADLEISHIPLVELFKEPLRPELEEALTDSGFNVRDVLSDAEVIREMRRHFLFVSSLGMPIRFRPNRAGFNSYAPEGPVAVDRENSMRAIISPRTLSAALIGNHYIENLNASTTHALFINPLGVNYTGMLTFDGHGLDWWMSYSDGYLGGGFNYTVNFDRGTFWSNGNASYLTVGGAAGGWRDYLTAGISLSTLLGNGVGIGASASVSVTRAHDVTYLGEYPLDGKIAAIRGLHKIEIDDTVGVSATGTVAINFSAAEVPLTVAFRAGAEYTRRRIYRTHADLEKTQGMLKEADIPGVLFLLGKKIKKTRVPKFEDPDILIDGDELVEIKTGTLSGAFVIGLESIVPIHAARIGASIDVTAEFELGLRRLPNYKFEVSIEPKQVYEMGFYASILNLLGAGYIKSIAVARKQIFIFDFQNSEARRAYFDLIHHGRLPTSEEIEIHSEDRGPEYLLTEFRAQNVALQNRGIARTYLEKVRIHTSKKHIGLNAPLVPAIVNVVNKIDKESRKSKEKLNLRFEGIDREFIRSHAKSVATNGLISVRRSTFGGRRSIGQGFSGRYNQDLFVTHRRIHTIDESPNEFAGNKWQFDSLIVHGQLEDTVITGDEENKMAEKINQLFSTFIGPFEYRNSKAPRLISIERELSKRDLDDLTRSEASDRILVASQTTGVDPQRLTMLLKKIKNKHPDHQGLIVKHFIETSPGLTGFAAIHQLLGARPEDLYIRTESGYTAAVMDAKKFIAQNSKIGSNENNPAINLVPISSRKNRKAVQNFYDQARGHLREIDKQLRLLNDDQYLLDEKSPLVKIYGRDGPKKIQELVDAGIRQDKTSFKSALVSSRKTILELMDLESQNFDADDRLIIYKMAGKKRLRMKEQIELFLRKYEHKPIKLDMPKDYVRTRLKKSWDMIVKIDRRIKRLEADYVMQQMDNAYVQSLTEELLRLRDRLAQTVSLAHLSDEEKRLLNDQVRYKNHAPFALFRRRKHRDFNVDGVFAEVFSTVSQPRLREPDPDPVTIENDDKDSATDANSSSTSRKVRFKLNDEELTAERKKMFDDCDSYEGFNQTKSSRHDRKLARCKSERFNHSWHNKKEEFNGLEFVSEASF